MTARVYVGTYAKYNAGSITGRWLDLEDYADHDAFIEACRELHKDEDDPELMFQDYEGFPDAYYGESHIKPELWDWLELSEQEREVVDTYLAHVDQHADPKTALDAYVGHFDSPEDWAQDRWIECGLLDLIPGSLRNYIDYKAYARDAGFEGITFARVGGQVIVFHPV